MNRATPIATGTARTSATSEASDRDVEQVGDAEGRRCPPGRHSRSVKKFAPLSARAGTARQSRNAPTPLTRAMTSHPAPVESPEKTRSPHRPGWEVRSAVRRSPAGPSSTPGSAAPASVGRRDQRPHLHRWPVVHRLDETAAEEVGRVLGGTVPVGVRVLRTVEGWTSRSSGAAYSGSGDRVDGRGDVGLQSLRQWRVPDVLQLLLLLRAGEKVRKLLSSLVVSASIPPFEQSDLVGDEQYGIGAGLFRRVVELSRRSLPSPSFFAAATALPTLSPVSSTAPAPLSTFATPEVVVAGVGPLDVRRARPPWT